MESGDTHQEPLISSKEILERTGISRATLNNYIRIGILPRPLVQRPLKEGTGVKKIGYFPHSVLERIQRVHQLKQQGKSIGEIVELLRIEAGGAQTGKEQEVSAKGVPIMQPAELDRIRPSELRLTFEEISFPSYFLDYDFDLSWVNREAEVKLFKGIIKHSEASGLNNIFRLLFHWEFHRQVANWKNLVQLHMAHAKLVKTGKTWISRLYRGISDGEISVLEKIYDQVVPVPSQTIRETYLSFLSKEGSSDLFKVISLFAKHGILFVYIPEEIGWCHGQINSGM